MLVSILFVGLYGKILWVGGEIRVCLILLLHMLTEIVLLYGYSKLLMWLCHLVTLWCSFCHNLLHTGKLLLQSANACQQETACLCTDVLFSENFRGCLYHLPTSRMNQHGNVACDMPRRLVSFIVYWSRTMLFFCLSRLVSICLCCSP